MVDGLGLKLFAAQQCAHRCCVAGEPFCFGQSSECSVARGLSRCVVQVSLQQLERGSYTMLSTQDEQSLRVFIEQHYSPELQAQLPINLLLADLREVRQVFENQTPQSIDRSTDKLTLKTDNGAGESIQLSFALAPSPPHRIIGLDLNVEAQTP